MQKSGMKRVIPIIIILIIVVIAITALISIGRSLFGGSDAPDATMEQQTLLDTSPSRSVRMTMRGPIVADENFHSYDITVSAAERTITTYQGYRDSVVERRQFGNNLQAYEEFVYALDRTSMMDAQPFSGDNDDVRGICAGGRVIEFELRDGENVVKRLWTSTCKNAGGSLRANSAPLQNLFRAQIPDSRAALATIDL